MRLCPKISYHHKSMSRNKWPTWSLCSNTYYPIICRTCVLMKQRNYNKEEYDAYVKIKYEFIKHQFPSLQVKQCVLNWIHKKIKVKCYILSYEDIVLFIWRQQCTIEIILQTLVYTWNYVISPNAQQKLCCKCTCTSSNTLTNT